MGIYIMGSSQEYSFMDRWLESSIPKSHHRKKTICNTICEEWKNREVKKGALSEHSHLAYEN